MVYETPRGHLIAWSKRRVKTVALNEADQVLLAVLIAPAGRGVLGHVCIVNSEGRGSYDLAGSYGRHDLVINRNARHF